MNTSSKIASAFASRLPLILIVSALLSMSALASFLLASNQASAQDNSLPQQKTTLHRTYVPDPKVVKDVNGYITALAISASPLNSNVKEREEAIAEVKSWKRALMALGVKVKNAESQGLTPMSTTTAIYLAFSDKRWEPVRDEIKEADKAATEAAMEPIKVQVTYTREMKGPSISEGGGSYVFQLYMHEEAHFSTRVRYGGALSKHYGEVQNVQAVKQPVRTITWKDDPGTEVKEPLDIDTTTSQMKPGKEYGELEFGKENDKKKSYLFKVPINDDSLVETDEIMVVRFYLPKALSGSGYRRFEYYTDDEDPLHFRVHDDCYVPDSDIGVGGGSAGKCLDYSIQIDENDRAKIVARQPIVSEGDDAEFVLALHESGADTGRKDAKGRAIYALGKQRAARVGEDIEVVATYDNQVTGLKSTRLRWTPGETTKTFSFPTPEDSVYTAQTGSGSLNLDTQEKVDAQYGENVVHFRDPLAYSSSAYSLRSQTVGPHFHLINDGDDYNGVQYFPNAPRCPTELGCTQSGLSLAFLVEDDDPRPTLTVGSPSVVEGDEGETILRYPVRLSPASHTQVSARYVDKGAPSGQGNVAISGEDYEAIASTTLTFAPGQVRKTVEVKVKGDYLEEPDEQVWLTFENVKGTALPGDVSELPIPGTIRNDDKNVKIIPVLEKAGVMEGESAVFSLRLSEPIDSTLEIRVEDTPGTATRGDDYTRPNRRLSFSFPYQGTEPYSTLAFPIIEDDDTTGDEPVETFSLKITGSPNVQYHPERMKKLFGPKVGGGDFREIVFPVVKILDGPTVMVGDAPEVAEGGDAVFPITLTEPAAADVTLEWQTVDGYDGSDSESTAKAGADYTAQTAQTLTIPAGQTSAQLRVATIQDTVDESNQLFSVKVNSVTGADLYQNVAMGIIRDDDARPTLSIADATAPEGEKLTFAVNLSAASERTVTVQWHTEDSKYARDSRIDLVYPDYTGYQRQTLVFAPGETRQVIETVTLSDDRNEAAVNLPGNKSGERLLVQLYRAINARIDDGKAVGSIEDDDPVKITVSDVTVNEPKSASKDLVNFTISLSSPQPNDVELQYRTQDGVGTYFAAYAGRHPSNTIYPYIDRENEKEGDYESVDWTDLTIKAGDTSKDVPITVLRDYRPEEDEHFVVEARLKGQSEEEAVSGRGVIIDDDYSDMWLEGVPANYIINEGTGKDTAYTITVKRKAPNDKWPYNFPPYDVRFLICFLDESPDYAGVDLTKSQVEPGLRQPSHLTPWVRPEVDVYLKGPVKPDVLVDKHGVARCEDTRETSSWYSIAIKGAKNGQPKKAGTVEQTTFTFSVRADNRPEKNETFTVFMRPMSINTYPLRPSWRQGRYLRFTIIDDDGNAATVSADKSKYTEGEEAEFTITLSKGAAKEVSLTYALNSETAVAGDDFDPHLNVERKVTFAPGETQKKLKVALMNDRLVEDSESFSLVLTGVVADETEGVFIPVDRGSATVEIADDDEAIATLSASDTAVDEGQYAEISVNLDQPIEIRLQGEQPAVYTRQDANNQPWLAQFKKDYAVNSLGVDGFDAIQIAKGRVNHGVRIITNQDRDPELDESFPARIVDSPSAHASHYTVVNSPEAMVIIRDNDGGSPQISGLTNDSVEEGLRWISPKPNASGVSIGDLTWRVSGPDASHFSINADTGLLTLPPQDFDNPVDSDSDNIYEVTATVVDEDGGLDTQALKVTVTDSALVSIDDATAIAEGNDPSATTDMIFTVTLSSVSGKEITVPYTLGGTATPGDDYTDPADKSVTIAAGQKTGSIIIKVKGDTLNEDNETIIVTLGEPTNANLSTTPSEQTATGTINDDDALPTVSIKDDITVAEGGKAVFTIELSTQSSQDITVQWATGDDTANGAKQATAGSDYTSITAATTTISAGTTSITVEVQTTQDSLDEPDETFIVTLTNPANATLGSKSRGKATITDDDSEPTASITNADAVTEGNDPSATTDMTFTVTLSTVSGKAVTVPYTLGGTATAGTDYTDPTNKSIIIAAGQKTGDIIIKVKGDTVDEADETIIVTLSAPTNAGLPANDADKTATGTITDDDDLPTVKVDNADAVTEGNDPNATTDMTFTVTLSAVSGKAVTIPYTLGGTATAGTDYTDPTTKSITIAAGQKTGDIIIKVKGDTVDEANETITVTLSTPSNAQLSSTPDDSAATGTITDDDVLKNVKISVENTDNDDDNDPKDPKDPEEPENPNKNTVPEDAGSTEIRVTVTLSSDTTSSQDETILISVGLPSDTATVGDDYKKVNDFYVVIPAGKNEVQASFALTVFDDTADEIEEESITVTGSHDTMIITAALVTITDNDDPPTLKVTDATAVTEGDDPAITTDMVFDVSLSTTSGKTITVPYTLSGTATAGTDYTDPATKSLTIAAGQKTGSIAIPIKGDTIDETNETLVVTLSDPTNAQLSATSTDRTATGIITDDDDPPTVSINDAPAVAEGDKATFTIELSAASGLDVTVQWTTGDDTSLNAKKATEGSDYTAVTTAQTVSIAAGTTSANVEVQTTEDALNEETETFMVTLASPTNATLGTKSSGKGTINDDDGKPSVSIKDAPAVTEGGKSVFAIELSATSSLDVTVQWTTGDDTSQNAKKATAGADYTAVTSPQTATIKAGTTSVKIEVQTSQDTVDEDAETFVATLSNPGNAALGTKFSGKGTINDDDDPPTLKVSDATAITEGNDPAITTDMTFEVSLSTTSGKTITVPYTLSGAATAGADYTDPATKSITISAGQTSGDIVIPIKGDAIDEDNETVAVSLGAPTNATISSDAGAGSASGIINDDDTRGVTIAETDGSTAVAEPSGADTYTVVLTSQPTADVTVALTLDPTSGAIATDVASLTFNPSEWNKRQTVTVTAVNDDVDNPNDARAATISHAVSGGDYATVKAASVSVTITDDDAAPPVIPGGGDGGSGGGTPPTVTVNLSADQMDWIEGGHVYITATLSAALDQDVVIPVDIEVCASDVPAECVDQPFTAESSDIVQSHLGPTDSLGSLNGRPGEPNYGIPPLSIEIPAGKISGFSSVGARLDADDDNETFAATLATSSSSWPASIAAGEVSSLAIAIADEGMDHTAGRWWAELSEEARQSWMASATPNSESLPLRPGLLSYGALGDAMRAQVVVAAGEVLATLDENHASEQAWWNSLGNDDDGCRMRLMAVGMHKKEGMDSEWCRDWPDNDDPAMLASESTDLVETVCKALLGTLSEEDSSSPGPIASISDASAMEGIDTHLIFVISLNEPPYKDARVNYITRDGTATAGADYAAQKGSVYFHHYEMEHTVLVPVNADDLEESEETMELVITGIHGAIIEDGVGEGSIADASTTSESNSEIQDNNPTDVAMSNSDQQDGNQLDNAPSDSDQPDSAPQDSDQPDNILSDNDLQDSDQPDGDQQDNAPQDSDQQDSVLLDNDPQDSDQQDGNQLDNAPSDSDQPDNVLPDNDPQDSDQQDGNQLDNAPSDSDQPDNAPSDSDQPDNVPSDGDQQDSDQQDNAPQDSEPQDNVPSDNALPEISIVASGGITEGGDAVFTLTASPAPSADISVTVNVSQQGDYGIAAGSQTVTIGANSDAILTVATTDDDIDESDGSVTAILAIGSGYTVSASQGSATVSVADDDDAPKYAPNPTVVANVRSYVAESQNGEEHVTRWKRVLVALGVEDYPGITPMSSTEAQTYADKGWTRWDPVVTELKKAEAFPS